MTEVPNADLINLRRDIIAFNRKIMPHQIAGNLRTTRALKCPVFLARDMSGLSLKDQPQPGQWESGNPAVLAGFPPPVRAAFCSRPEPCPARRRGAQPVRSVSQAESSRPGAGAP